MIKDPNIKYSDQTMEGGKGNIRKLRQVERDSWSIYKLHNV